MLLQGNDFLELYRRYGCTLQTRRQRPVGQHHRRLRPDPPGRRRAASTRSPRRWSPRPTARSSARPRAARVWLDPAMTSPYAFYQFWLNTDDRDVAQPTCGSSASASREEIEALEAAAAERPQAREAQRALAEELTTLVHGEAARAAGDRRLACPVRPGRAGRPRRRRRSRPRCARRRTSEVAAGATPTVVDLLADTGLVASRSAARRAVEEGGAYVNNARVADVDAAVDASQTGCTVATSCCGAGKRTVGGAIRAS